LLSGIDCRVQQAPVFFVDAALVGFGVAYLHGFGAEAGVLGESLGGDAEEFGLEVCELLKQNRER
jgi:hypothetical protein